MNDANKKLSVIAYYLSEYDRKAMSTLGYNTLTETFKMLSLKFGKDNNYLKLRRDEFDVLTNSHRNGWKNRAPANDVVTIYNGLKNIPFDQLTEIVMDMLNNTDFTGYLKEESINIKQSISHEFSEDEIEQLINYKDLGSRRNIVVRRTFNRIYNHNIINKLKRQYNFKCQICGIEFYNHYGVNIVEAHHIVPFAESENNDISNVIILCPNHHRLIHKANVRFDRENLQFIYPNDKKEKLILNFHI